MSDINTTDAATGTALIAIGIALANTTSSWFLVFTLAGVVMLLRVLAKARTT